MPQTPDKLSAGEALLDYGYTRGEDGRYRHPTVGNPTQEWIEVKGEGWTRLDPAPAAVIVPGNADLAGLADPAAGAPWGRPHESGLLEVPYRQLERFAGVSGLHPLTHGEMFEWVWPDAVVAELYAYAYKSNRPAYKREGDQLVVDRDNKLGR